MHKPCQVGIGGFIHLHRDCMQYVDLCRHARSKCKCTHRLVNKSGNTSTSHISRRGNDPHIPFKSRMSLPELVDADLCLIASSAVLLSATSTSLQHPISPHLMFSGNRRIVKSTDDTPAPHFGSRRPWSSTNSRRKKKLHTTVTFWVCRTCSITIRLYCLLQYQTVNRSPSCLTK